MNAMGWVALLIYLLGASRSKQPGRGFVPQDRRALRQILIGRRHRRKVLASAYSSDRKAAAGRLHVWASWRFVVQTPRGIVR
jgi:hypothetical protein